MSDDNDIDKKIADLVAKASEKKIIQSPPKLVKQVDVSALPDVKNAVLQMRKDGYTTAQIAAAMGYEEGKIKYLLEEKIVLAEPEQLLKDTLQTLMDLVPLAESTYRTNPSFHNSMALTGIVGEAKSIIAELDKFNDKEDIYRTIIMKVVQPFIRGMISDMMVEFRTLTHDLEKSPDKATDLTQTTALNIGKKFEEAYRRTTDLLAQIVGLNADAKARALASLGD